MLFLIFVVIVALHSFEEWNERETKKRNKAFFKKIESFKF
jgi:hypothetical protein